MNLTVEQFPAAGYADVGRLARGFSVLKAQHTRKKDDMKAVFDLTKCSGHARCYQIDPELFDIDESGYAYASVIDISVGDEQKAHDAVEGCPERAISIR